MPLTSHRKPHHGFTILEMAIVLLIISVLTASLIGPLTNYLYQRQVADTQKSLEEIKEALLGYAAANGHLPAPTLSANNGQAPLGGCGTPIDCSGFVPWETLGTSKLDAWGKIFQYSVTPAFTSGQVKFSFVGTKIVCSAYDSTSSNCTKTLATNVPALVWSFGRRNWGTNEAGTSLPNLGISNTDEELNRRILSANMTAIMRGYSEAGATGGEFDDQLVWLSTQLLFNRMLSAGQQLN